jgi:hypothetical protein
MSEKDSLPVPAEAPEVGSGLPKRRRIWLRIVDAIVCVCALFLTVAVVRVPGAA